MAIDDITKEPLGLIKLSQVVLLVISIGCVFGPANGWWYYVGATLIAAFLNAIIMIICYYWKQSFEGTFLELSYTTYFVVAIFISAILLFVQPHYAEAPWEHGGTSTLGVIDVNFLIRGGNTNTTAAESTIPPTTEESTTASLLSTTETESPTTKSATTETTAAQVAATVAITTEEVTAIITSESTFLSTTEELSTTSLLSTTETESSTTKSTTTEIPPEPHYKDGTWIAGGVFCLFLFLTYSAELYFLTRRLVNTSG